MSNTVIRSAASSLMNGQKYVQINTNAWGWADQIIFSKHEKLLSQGVDSYVIWGRGRSPKNDHEFRLLKYPELEYPEYISAAVATRLDGKFGFHSVGPTRRLLNILDQIDPDVVHLHSLLDYFVNVEMLFEWLARNDCHVLWTLHDCWAFTGYCMHFTYVGCEQWKTSCTNNCPCLPPDRYPELRLRSKVDWCFKHKRKIFTMLPPERLTLITPSRWLAGLTRDSFLAKYPVRVIHNKIDKNIFKPTLTNFRTKYHIGNRFIVLGVASHWGVRKGYEDMLRLSRDLGPRFAVVLVGLERKQIQTLPTDTSALLVGIGKTSSREEMAGIYTAVDVLMNPTKEDNYPTVNLEAEACGTPVITYDVGGCAETISLNESRVVKGYTEALEAITTMSMNI